MLKNKYLFIIYRTETKNRETLLSRNKSRSDDLKILVEVPFLLRSFWI